MVKIRKGAQEIEIDVRVDRGSFNVIIQGQGENCKSSKGMEQIQYNDARVIVEEAKNRSGQGHNSGKASAN